MRSNNFRPLTFRVPDASHVEGNKYRTTSQMMRDHSRAYKEWVASRKELESEVKQLTLAGRTREASQVKGELLAVQFWERPAEEYATTIEPLPGRDVSELHLTSGGKLRSKEKQEEMKDYIQFKGRLVPRKNSSRTPVETEEERMKKSEDERKEKAEKLLADTRKNYQDGLDALLRETLPGVKSTYTKPKK